VNLLLDSGADPNITGSDGNALEVAVSMNRREAAKALRAHIRDPCKLCGRPFFPLCYHVEAPKVWGKFTEEQKDQRDMKLSFDLCQTHEDFFIRGIVEIPIISSNATAEISAADISRSVNSDTRHQPGQLHLCFGVFVQVSKESFDQYVKHWNTPGREDLLEPLDGFLANVIPHWKSTFNAPCQLVPQKVGCRPIIRLSDHPLRIAQNDGITFQLTESIKGLL
jgi:hypothetical protein